MTDCWRNESLAHWLSKLFPTIYIDEYLMSQHTHTHTHTHTCYQILQVTYVAILYTKKYFDICLHLLKLSEYVMCSVFRQCRIILCDLFCTAAKYHWIKWFTTEILEESSSDEGGSDADSGSSKDSDDDEGWVFLHHNFTDSPAAVLYSKQLTDVDSSLT